MAEIGEVCHCFENRANCHVIVRAQMQRGIKRLLFDNNTPKGTGRQDGTKTRLKGDDVQRHRYDENPMRELEKS